METFDAQRYTGEVRFDTNGVLHIATMGTKVVQVPLTNILHATLGPGSIDIDDFRGLAEGWASHDVGQVGMTGRAGQSNDTFAIRVASGDIGGPADSFHFVWHPMAGAGEIQARGVTMRAADLLAKTGVMIREDLSPDSPFVMASLSAGGRAVLQWRGTRGERAREVSGPREYAWPQFLRLQKEGQLFTAAVSGDRQQWQTVGTTNVGMTDRELHVGLALASHGELSLSTVVLDRLNLRVNGLLGQYFARPNWKELVLSRVDAQIQFAWRTMTLDPRLPGRKFSVRWLGEIVPRYSEDYSFFYEAEGTASLWIDGHLMPRQSLKDRPQKPSMPLSLIAGHRYPVKFEVSNEEGLETVRLGWESPSQHREVIPEDQLFASLSPMSPSTTTKTVSALRHWAPGRGVVLRDGSFLSGTVKSVDRMALTLSWRNEHELVLPLHKVARAVLRVPPPDLNIGTATNSTGLLLSTGDFLEGDVSPPRVQRVEVNSVLFGPREFGIDTGEVMVAVMHRVDTLPFRYEVRTTDDSAVRCSSVTIGAEELILRTSLLEELRLPLAIVEQLRGQKNPYLRPAAR